MAHPERTLTGNLPDDLLNLLGEWHPHFLTITELGLLVPGVNRSPRVIYKQLRRQEARGYVRIEAPDGANTKIGQLRAFHTGKDKTA